MNKDILRFLIESNAIEGVYGARELPDTIEAWERATSYKRRGLDIYKLCQIHGDLMYGLRPDIAGDLRKVNLWSPKNTPDHTLVSGLLQELLNSPVPENEEEVRQWHIKFEKIHPFEDGNGRVGRILMNAQRLQIHLPVLIIYEAGKHEYYEWFDQKVPTSDTE